jgi:hypothetical protein
VFLIVYRTKDGEVEVLPFYYEAHQRQSLAVIREVKGYEVLAEGDCSILNYPITEMLV